jgi:HAD superfamily hydrolase (TIGR01484 family)
VTNSRKLLASDLDGTLIPPSREEPRLREIAELADAVGAQGLEVAYITGRHRELALEGIEDFQLPYPDLLVCDVGTSVYRRTDRGFVLDEDYRERMREALGGTAGEELRGRLEGVEGLTPQEPEKQAEFKVSYYFEPAQEADLLAEVRERLGRVGERTKMVASRDPITGTGLLDLLPARVAKHRALEYLREASGRATDDVVYAGDSGNDLDALLSGHPAIVVANAPESLRDDLRREGESSGILHRIYFARRPYAGGVVEGCRYFGVLP